jgi:hypothetical protein
MGNPARKIEQITNWSAISVVFLYLMSLNLDLYNAFTQFICHYFSYSFNISSETHAIFMYIYFLFDPEND